MALGSSDDLERELERELARAAEKLSGPSPRPAQSAYHRFARRPAVGTLLRSATSVYRGAAASAAAACLLLGGGALAATAATGSPDPVVWGTSVTRAVATCRDSLPPGERGIGPCVASVARPVSPAERTSHVVATPAPVPATGPSGTDPSATPAAQPPPAAASTPPSGGTNQDPNTPGSGRPSTLPPQANGEATGRPATVPAGPPAVPPGQSGSGPGQSASAPGQSTTPPGQATGSTRADPGRSTVKPSAHS